MKEPVYECKICDTTLERWEQGKYIWCARCRHIWDEGFNAGIQNRDLLMGTKGMMDTVMLYEKLAPYMVIG